MGIFPDPGSVAEVVNLATGGILVGDIEVSIPLKAEMRLAFRGRIPSILILHALLANEYFVVRLPFPSFMVWSGKCRTVLIFGQPGSDQANGLK